MSDILENIKTIDSYRSMNNKNKNQNNQKKENINNLKNLHRNFLQNDINSFLDKKEKKDINVENLSVAFKKFDNNARINDLYNNNIQKENEKKEETKNNEIKKDVNDISKNPIEKLVQTNDGIDEIILSCGQYSTKGTIDMLYKFVDDEFKIQISNQ